MLTAESNYITSRAQYQQVIGIEPGRVVPAPPVDRFSPRNLPVRWRARAPSIPRSRPPPTMSTSRRIR